VFGVKAELLCQRSRIKALVDARAAICYVAVREFGINGVELARVLNMSRSGVSVAAKRGGELIAEKQALRDKLIDKSTTSP